MTTSDYHFESQRMIQMELFCLESYLGFEDIALLDFEDFSKEEIEQMRRDLPLEYSFWASERYRKAQGKKSLYGK